MTRDGNFPPLFRKCHDKGPSTGINWLLSGYTCCVGSAGDPRLGNAVGGGNSGLREGIDPAPKGGAQFSRIGIGASNK